MFDDLENRLYAWADWINLQTDGGPGAVLYFPSESVEHRIRQMAPAKDKLLSCSWYCDNCNTRAAAEFTPFWTPRKPAKCKVCQHTRFHAAQNIQHGTESKASKRRIPKIPPVDPQAQAIDSAVRHLTMRHSKLGDTVRLKYRCRFSDRLCGEYLGVSRNRARELKTLALHWLEAYLVGQGLQ